MTNEEYFVELDKKIESLYELREKGVLLRERNLVCAGPILRLQMDNCMRMHATFIAEDRNAKRSSIGVRRCVHSICNSALQNVKRGNFNW